MLEKLEEGGGGVSQMSYDASERGEGVSYKRQNTVRKWGRGYKITKKTDNI